MDRTHALVVQALRLALDAPGESRLFRAGKLPGLFPARAGAAGDAAAFAVREGLVEVTRTEARGRSTTEWARATPRGVEYLAAHDSPRAVVEELRAALKATQAGVPVWMDDVRRELHELSARFAAQAERVVARLGRLEGRLAEALRRLDAGGPGVSDGLAAVVPWGRDALAYLDRRKEAGADGCPLPELFEALRAGDPDLTVTAFHDGLRRLRDARALRLAAGDAIDRPEYALPDGAELLYLARR